MLLLRELDNSVARELGQTQLSGAASALCYRRCAQTVLLVAFLMARLLVRTADWVVVKPEIHQMVREGPASRVAMAALALLKVIVLVLGVVGLQARQVMVRQAVALMRQAVRPTIAQWLVALLVTQVSLAPSGRCRRLSAAGLVPAVRR